MGVTLATTVSFALPLALKHAEEGIGIGVVLAIVSLAMLGVALREVASMQRAPSPTHVGSALLAWSALWSAFMLAVLTVSPGPPLAHAEVVAVPSDVPVDARATGRRVTLVVRGALPDGLANTVHFTVIAPNLEIRGRLSREQRTIQIAGQRARATEADATFSRTFDMPRGATTLRVTALNGPLDGALVLELFARQEGRRVGLIIAVAAILLATFAERMLDMRGYATPIAAGMGASLLVAAKAQPGWQLERAIMAVALGAITGLFVGLMAAWAVRRARPRAGHRS